MVKPHKLQQINDDENMRIIRRWQSHSSRETFAIGKQIGTTIQCGLSIGLVGDLGVGKTLFVQGLAVGLGVSEQEPVVSPTFSIVHHHMSGRIALIHADLYRLEHSSSLEHIGIEEWMDDQHVVVIEWSNRFAVLPTDALEIHITRQSSRIDHRCIDIMGLCDVPWLPSVK